MDANEYQKLAKRTAQKGYSPTDQLVNAALGLTGEAGEFADLVKKFTFHQHDLDREKMIGELGDCVWYLALACSTLSISLGDVMQHNIDKLRKRPSGFSTADSIARVDTQPDEPEPEPEPDAWLWGERVNYIGPAISPTEGD